MQRFVLAATFLTVVGVVEASACSLAPFGVNFGWDTSTVLQVGSGKGCSVLLHAGARSTFSGIAISAPARNGTAHAGSSAVSYRSKPGYKGADTFAFTVTGADTRGSGKFTVQVGVTVQ